VATRANAKGILCILSIELEMFMQLGCIKMQESIDLRMGGW
jgi:hypothetical protein